jgi:hypothetical protein
LHVLGAPYDNEKKLLVDDNGVPFAEASLRTQAGDWYIYGSWGKLGLVVRAPENSILTIVGLARKLGNHHHFRVEHTWVFRKERITVYWDPEDALLLRMWMCNGIHDDGLDDDGLDDDGLDDDGLDDDGLDDDGLDDDGLNDTGICRFDNSSYAEFDDPKAMERQDDEVWRELHDWERRVHDMELCYIEKAFKAYPAFRPTTQKSR